MTLVASQRARSRRAVKSTRRSASGKAKRGGAELSSQLRVLDLLSLVASSERPLALPEITAALDASKPTVFRMCQRLETAGYLEREPGGRHFRIGPSLIRLGLSAVRGGSAHVGRHAILEALVAAIGETCNCTMLAGSEVYYLDRVETRWPLRMHLEPGSRVPVHCTASGKLFLANLAPAARDALLAHLPLEPHTSSTITSRKALVAALEEIRKRDYSIDNEEFLVGLIAIAVPVRDRAGNVVAALACHAPLARMSIEEAVRQLPRLRAAARKLAATLPA